MKRTRFVLVISAPGWSDSIASIHTSQRAAEATLARWVRDAWPDVFGGEPDCHLTPSELIASYFERSLDDESYEILPV